jgi:hypothetical protein
MAGFFNWIGFFNGPDKRKKKLTDIGLFGFSWMGNGSFQWIWIILINVC